MTIMFGGVGHLISNPGKVVCISHSAYTFGKVKNLIILPPAMGK